MKQIFLVNSPMYAVVDDDDYERLMKYKWYLHSRGYVWRYILDGYVMLHHEVLLIAPEEGKHVDHINQNKLDNYKSNLRVISRGASMQNRGKWNKHNLRGVTQLRNGGRFQSKIQFNGVRLQLGTYDTVEEAARAYDRKALELFGINAALNYPKEDYL